jgi:hypothetical protein
VADEIASESAIDAFVEQNEADGFSDIEGKVARGSGE